MNPSFNDNFCIHQIHQIHSDSPAPFNDDKQFMNLNVVFTFSCLIYIICHTNSSTTILQQILRYWFFVDLNWKNASSNDMLYCSTGIETQYFAIMFSKEVAFYIYLELINPFQSTITFLYPLKTSENVLSFCIVMMTSVMDLLMEYLGQDIQE